MPKWRFPLSMDISVLPKEEGGHYSILAEGMTAAVN